MDNVLRFLPSIKTEPDVNGVRPERQRKSVVLPDPEGPRILTNSPAFAEKSMPCNIFVGEVLLAVLISFLI